MAVHTVVPDREIPQVVPFPLVHVTPEPITQLRLELLLSLRLVAEQAKARVDAAEADLKAALAGGASVEPGTHTASLKESFRRNISWKDVSVRLAQRLYGEARGAAYAANVLQNTKPDRMVSLVVS